MAASHESIVVLETENRATLLAAVAEFARRQGWKVVTSTDRLLECLVPINVFSWGERIRVAAEGHELRILSVCRFPLQVVDWGKNRRNVDLIRACVHRVLVAACS